MSKSSQRYERRFTKKFQEQLDKLRDKTRIRRIKERVDEIVAYPYQHIDFGKGHWRGKRKDSVGKDRIAFTICEQCRKEDHEGYNNCLDCDATPGNMITFWEIITGHKY